MSCNTNRNVQLSDFEKSRWKVLTNDLINDFWKAIGYAITVKSVLLNMSHRQGYTFNNLLQCTYNYTCTLTSQYIPCLNLFLHIHDLHNQNCKRRLISLIINNSTPILKLVGKSIHKNLTLRQKLTIHNKFTKKSKTQNEIYNFSCSCWITTSNYVQLNRTLHILLLLTLKHQKSQ